MSKRCNINATVKLREADLGEGAIVASICDDVVEAGQLVAQAAAEEECYGEMSWRAALAAVQRYAALVVRNTHS